MTTIIFDPVAQLERRVAELRRLARQLSHNRTLSHETCAEVRGFCKDRAFELEDELQAWRRRGQA